MIQTLYPYLLNRTIWVFDDPRPGIELKEEAFVSGMTEMISRIVEAKAIPNAAQGFLMTFSDKLFEGYDAELQWLRADGDSQPCGNWYRGIVAGLEMEGWLCGALFHFFTSAPAHLYVHAGPLPPGIDPIWHLTPESQPRRFISPDGKQCRAE